MSKLHYYVILGALGLLLAASSILFTVDQRQLGIIFQFGEAVRVIKAPGLHAKIPFIQNIEFFDKYLLHADVEAKELTASDGKRIMVNAFAKFTIEDPIAFYKTVHNYQGIKIRLNKILESSMRRVIGRIPLTALLTNGRSEVMYDIYSLVDGEVADFGIKVSDVRILRTDLPKENSAAIYRRMQAEREKEAKQILAEGQEEAVRIRSKAEKESKILIAEAQMQAQIIKGEGDAEAIKIYNTAYASDPEFFKFYRSLEAYKAVLQKDNTSFVLTPESDFFKYLNLGK